MLDRRDMKDRRAVGSWDAKTSRTKREEHLHRFRPVNNQSPFTIFVIDVERSEKVEKE